MTKGGERLVRGLRSPRLALALLAAIATLAVAGSFFSPEKGRAFYENLFGESLMPLARWLALVDTFHSPLFVALVLLLVLNILFCTTHRFLRRRRASGGEPDARRRLLPWIDLAMHLSVIVILAAGAAKGMWGFAGTQYFFVDVPENQVFHWRSETDVPLGFAVIVRDIEKEYYPLQVKIGVSRRAAEEKIALLELQGGEEASPSGEDLTLAIEAFDRDTGLLSLRASIPGKEGLVELESRPEGRVRADFGPYGLTFVAFRQELKTIRSRAEILEGGRKVREVWFSPNTGVRHGGSSLFKTAWGEDREGNSFVGIQVIRDPAAPLFWTGCTLLSLAVPVFFFLRHRGRRRDG